ncbi:MAG: TonB-dependent siderophore receptor [Novosphingobium sp.]
MNEVMSSIRARSAAMKFARMLSLGVSVIALAPALPAMAQSQPAAAARTQFDVPAQSLEGAVTAFGLQSGLRISADQSILAGRQSPGVSGNMGSFEALSRLLTGTGITWRQIDARSVTLVKAPESADSGAIQLGAVRVESATGSKGGASASLTSDPAASEGTGTYAAKAVSIFKGVESLREVPQTVSVLTRTQMDDQGLISLSRVFAQLPGTRNYGYDWHTRIMSRGFQIVMQVDGVLEQQQYGGSSNRMDPSIYDRVEMLHGPAGFLSGSGDPGGTVNLVRKRPQKTFQLSGNAYYGSWNDVRSDVDVTGPLNADGSLRARVVGVVEDKDEFYDVGKQNLKQIYGIVEYDISPRTTASLSTTQMKKVFNNYYGLPRYPDGSLPGRKSYVGTNDFDAVSNNVDYTVDLRHDFGNEWAGKATYIHRNDKNLVAGYYAYEMMDEDGLADFGGVYAKRNEYYRSFDINVHGPVSLFGQTHKLALGFNHSSRDQLTLSQARPYFEDADVLNFHTLGTTLADFTPAGEKLESTQYGLYGSANILVTDRLAFTLGGRYSSQDYFTRSAYGADRVHAQKVRGKFTPYAGVTYDLSKSLTAYGSYADIFMPQSNKDFAQTILPPRTGRQFEVGLKGAFLDGNLNASLAVYDMRDRNRAIRDDDPTHVCPGWPGYCYRAAGVIQSRGIEAEVSGTPFPGLNITGSYSLFVGKYLTADDFAVSGERFETASLPKHNFKLWAQYRFGDTNMEGGLARWTIGGGVTAQSALYYTDTDTRVSMPYRQEAYAIVSAKLGYRVNRHLDFAINADNLLDKTYLRDLGVDYYFNMYGEPRKILASVRYKFD